MHILDWIAEHTDGSAFGGLGVSAQPWGSQSIDMLLYVALGDQNVSPISARHWSPCAASYKKHSIKLWYIGLGLAGKAKGAIKALTTGIISESIHVQVSVCSGQRVHGCAQAFVSVDLAEVTSLDRYTVRHRLGNFNIMTATIPWEPPDVGLTLEALEYFKGCEYQVAGA